MGSHPNDKLLEQGLDRWRRRRLWAIEDEMLELYQDFQSASEGLGVAHRNPGDVREDIINYLWDKLNHSATELEQLDGRHQELMEMDLLHLIVEYKRRRKDKPRWTFQSY